MYTYNHMIVDNYRDIIMDTFSIESGPPYTIDMGVTTNQVM